MLQDFTNASVVGIPWKIVRLQHCWQITSLSRQRSSFLAIKSFMYRDHIFRVVKVSQKLIATYWKWCIRHCLASVFHRGWSFSIFLYVLKQEAASIALRTVLACLDKNPGQKLESIIFDMLTKLKEEIYWEKCNYFVPLAELTAVTDSPVSTMKIEIREQTLAVAKNWNEEANAVLICAGAGMTVKEGEWFTLSPHTLQMQPILSFE